MKVFRNAEGLHNFIRNIKIMADDFHHFLSIFSGKNEQKFLEISKYFSKTLENYLKICFKFRKNLLKIVIVRSRISQHFLKTSTKSSPNFLKISSLYTIHPCF